MKRGWITGIGAVVALIIGFGITFAVRTSGIQSPAPDSDGKLTATHTTSAPHVTSGKRRTRADHPRRGDVALSDDDGESP
jgi:hypothetical protein